jgi:hypothetical protein
MLKTEIISLIKIMFLSCTVVLVLSGLAGCLQSNTVITVKPDGSGTIEETFLMSKEFIQQMEAMMQQMADQMGAAQKGSQDKSAKKTFDMFDESKLRNKASDMGIGVTYVLGKKVTTERLEGYRAVYAFKDINKVKLNQNPGESVPSGPGETGDTSEKKKEYVEFRFTKGKPSTLTIRMPSAKPDPQKKETPGDVKNDEPDEQQAEKMMEQMKMMFQDMKIAMAIDVRGSIVETNATHVEGSRITLMEMDFGKLIQVPEKFREFSLSQPETLEDAKKLMGNIPGIKVDLNKEVFVKIK